MNIYSPAPGYVFRASASSPRVDWSEAEVHGAVLMGLYPAQFQRTVQSHLPHIVNATASPTPLSATPESMSSPRFGGHAPRRVVSSGSAASPLICTPRVDTLDVERPSLEGTKYSPLGTVYSSSESIPQLQTPVNTIVATPKLYNTPSSHQYSPFRPDAESTPANVLAANKAERRIVLELEPVSEESGPDAAPPRLNPRAPSFRFSPRIAPASPAPTLLERQHSDGSSTVRPNGTTPMPSRLPTASCASQSGGPSLRASAADPLSGYRRLATPFADFRWWEAVTRERELRAKLIAAA
ncbi:hypothetical protein AURDEDRAFT_122738 [Auricularia subglabra TFB-10046 SS5]|nr:hypothetical protein AURDEDRAFT_122738 [Auricularia subglabra TFB-10046 SS5]